MKLFQKLFNFYINSSIHVSLSVYALLRITEFYFGLLYNENLDCFIFFGTIVGYNFVKYAEFSKLNYSNISRSLKVIQVFTILCLIALVYYGLQLNLKTILVFIPFVVLTLYYVVPFGIKKNLRNVPSLKILIIAIVWVGATVIVPFFDVGKSLDFTVILASIQRLLFVITLTLPFDIRDFKSDEQSLQTIPQSIGVERAKKFGFVLLLITMLLEFFIAPNQDVKIIFSIIFLVLILFLQRASISQSKYYSSFCVEGIPLLWWVLIVFL